MASLSIRASDVLAVDLVDGHSKLTPVVESVKGSKTRHTFCEALGRKTYMMRLLDDGSVWIVREDATWAERVACRWCRSRDM
jgi:hypothetical protein